MHNYDVLKANINDEYNELETNLDDEIESASWWEIAKEKNLRTPTLLSLALMYFQQFAGINAVMFYAKTLFMVGSYFLSKNCIRLVDRRGENDT